MKIFEENPKVCDPFVATQNNTQTENELLSSRSAWKSMIAYPLFLRRDAKVSVKKVIVSSSKSAIYIKWRVNEGSQLNK